MAIRENVSKREQWFVKNISNRMITIGDLPRVPTFNPGDEYDLLAYHDKNVVGNSADLTTLSSLGWIRITKKKDNTSVSYSAASDINDAVATAEEDETGGLGGGGDTVKVSSNDTTAGYLNGKLVAGANVTLVEGNDGGNETLTIAAGAGASIAVEDDGVSTVAAADTLNFGTGLDVSDAGGGQADIVLASHTHVEADITDLTHTTDTHVNVGNEGSTIVSDAARVDFDSKFTVTDGGAGEADTTINEPNLTIWNLVVQGNQLISGGATWDSGLTFNVSDLVYVIDGVIYNSSATSVTATAADPTNARIDVLVVDTGGTVSIVDGTPAPNPLKPDIDESTQVEVTFIEIPAAASTPDVVTILIYDEDAGVPSEWAASTSDPEFTLNSASDPFNGTVSIEATSAANNDQVNFAAASLVDVSDVDILEFNIKSKATWPNAKRIQIRFTSGGTIVSDDVEIKDGDLFGFDSSNTTSYQNLAIDLGLFKLSTNQIDGMEMEVSGGGAAIGFYVDRIRLQENVPFGTALPPNWRTIVADEGSTVSDSTADILQILGDGGSSDAYIRTSIAEGTDTVAITLNRTLIENHIPMHLVGAITTNTDLYKALMGYAFKYRFSGPGIITNIIARQGTVDSGGSQATVDLVVNGISALSSPITLSGVADTDAIGSLGANIVISENDEIELDVTQGTNGDAEDLSVDIVFTTNLQR